MLRNMSPFIRKRKLTIVYSLMVLLGLVGVICAAVFLLRVPYQPYPCLPRRIHLSQASDVIKQKVSMTVSFSLDYASCQHEIPTVFYRQGMAEEKQATAEKQHFNFTSSVTGEYFESDWLYHVTLPNLNADTSYWYRIQMKPDENSGLRGSQDTTPTLSFNTPPLPGSPTTIAMLGDLGQTSNSSKTMAHIFRATLPVINPYPVSMVMISGDMSYADSDPHRWTSWLDLMEPLFQSTPLAVAAGNHEIECDNITNLPFVQYENYFSNPNRIGAAEIDPIADDYRNTLSDHSCSAPSQFLGHYNYGNSFYAFQHGLVQMVVLNSYGDSTVGSAQYKWLENELQGVNRTVTPWLVVSFHCPLYTTFTGHVNEKQAVNMKEAMEPLFIQYKVNLIVSGHDHAYLRTKSLAYGKVDDTKESPVYVTVGAGGNHEGHAGGYRNDVPESWVSKRDIKEYGFGQAHFANATHALWTWVRDGTTTEGIHDRVWLVNPHV